MHELVTLAECECEVYAQRLMNLIKFQTISSGMWTVLEIILLGVLLMYASVSNGLFFFVVHRPNYHEHIEHKQNN